VVAEVVEEGEEGQKDSVCQKTISPMSASKASKIVYSLLCSV